MFNELASTLLTNVRLGCQRLSRDKHSSLSWTLVNYGRKKFSNIAPRMRTLKALLRVGFAIAVIK
jgi:hypothetical protein